MPALAPLPPNSPQAIMDLATSLLVDQWKSVQGTALVSVAWATKLTPGLVSLAVHRMALALDTTPPVLVLQVGAAARATQHASPTAALSLPLLLGRSRACAGWCAAG